MENLLDLQKTIVRKNLSKEPQLQPNPIFFPITRKAEGSKYKTKKKQMVYKYKIHQTTLGGNPVEEWY